MPYPASAATESFWAKFFTSAGFGGAMAFIAAAIAARVAWVSLQHAKLQQKHDRWWDTLTWIYDRAVVEKEKRTALPQEITFSMLSELVREADASSVDRLQLGTIKSVISIFDVSPTEGNGISRSPGKVDGESIDPEMRLQDDAGSPSRFTVTEPAAVDAFEELQQAVDARSERGTKENAYLAYEKDVGRALEMALTVVGGIVMRFRSRATHSDFAVVSEGKVFVVEVKHFGSRPSKLIIFNTIDKLIAIIQERRPHFAGALIVTNALISAESRKLYDHKIGNYPIDIVTWIDDEQVPAIIEALRRIRVIGHE